VSRRVLAHRDWRPRTRGNIILGERSSDLTTGRTGGLGATERARRGSRRQPGSDHIVRRERRSLSRARRAGRPSRPQRRPLGHAALWARAGRPSSSTGGCSACGLRGDGDQNLALAARMNRQQNPPGYSQGIDTWPIAWSCGPPEGTAALPRVSLPSRSACVRLGWVRGTRPLDRHGVRRATKYSQIAIFQEVVTCTAKESRRRGVCPVAIGRSVERRVWYLAPRFNSCRGHEAAPSSVGLGSLPPATGTGRGFRLSLPRVGHPSPS
jgi:hypothetical protein